MSITAYADSHTTFKQSLRPAITQYSAADIMFLDLKEGQPFTATQKQAFIRVVAVTKQVDDAVNRVLRPAGDDASDVLEDSSIVQFSIQGARKACAAFVQV